MPSGCKDFCAGKGRYLKIGAAFVTIAVSIVDLVSDWFAFSVFIRHEGGNLAIALGVICALSSIVVIFEVNNGVMAYRVYSREPDITVLQGGVTVKNTKWERKLDMWQETVSCFLLFCEDFPSIIIMYITFKRGNCDLFNIVFEATITANLALLGTFISSIWKGLLSLKYCCCNCEYRGVKGGFCGKTCCCCCRFLRPLVAIILLGFTAFLYFTFNRDNQPRKDCILDILTTATP